MPNDEASLIRRAKKGDPAAFAEIYDRYQPAIYRYIFYRVSDSTTAEDLTGEVFVRVVEKIDRFAYRGRPLLSWLYTIARNLVVDHHRQASVLVEDEQVAVDATDIEETLEHTLTQQRLAAAVSHLTEDQRRVILLKFIEGVDNRTVARMLGKSVGAVKSLQHRGLAALRRVLEKNGG
jgi:RNA polymerase sigma-70 factor (ECF subfamily)